MAKSVSMEVKEVTHVIELSEKEVTTIRIVLGASNYESAKKHAGILDIHESKFLDYREQEDLFRFFKGLTEAQRII